MVAAFLHRSEEHLSLLHLRSLLKPCVQVGVEKGETGQFVELRHQVVERELCWQLGQVEENLVDQSVGRDLDLCLQHIVVIIVLIQPCLARCLL